MSRRTTRTRVGIVGGGPAGLTLSHLLARAGIENVVVERRDHETIRTSQRAGILEPGSVAMLVDSGVSDRVLTEGYQHDGIDLRFGGESHRIDFNDLVGESVWLYPQNEVFVDLSGARARDGGDVRYGVSGAVSDVDTDHPRITCTGPDGTSDEIVCDILVGTDGSQGISRRAIPPHARRDIFVEHPFAWFGILCEAPPSAKELVYARSEAGFALISQRNEHLQRMYFQCSPDEDVAAWSDDRIWAELQGRVAGPDGFALREGPIVDRSVLTFRSYVCEPLRHGRLFLAGDAGHTVPPTGAKGLNLALADVRVLFEALDSWATTGAWDLLDGYSERALQRVWRAQHFSCWMTTLLHEPADATDFERRRQLGELEAVVGSRHGSAYLAEAYTGWPNR